VLGKHTTFHLPGQKTFEGKFNDTKHSRKKAEKSCKKAVCHFPEFNIMKQLENVNFVNFPFLVAFFK